MKMEFRTDIIDRVWETGRATDDQDPTVWRKDECGAWINYEHYGSEESEFGWRILNVSVASSSEPGKMRLFHRENDFNRNTGLAVCHIRADRDEAPPTAQLNAPHNTRA